MMDERERTKLAVIKGAIDGVYTAARAAKKPGISKRWVKHLKRAVRENGDEGIIHGNSGRHPKSAKPPDLKKRVVTLKESGKYVKADFTHFREMPEEHEQIKISCSCLSGILREAGIASPKTHRTAGERHDMRPRRPLLGELVQTDASPFDWLGTGVPYGPHGFQDDASGDIPGLYLREHECLQGYFEAFRAVLTGHGVPEALYADRTGVFFVNTRKPGNRTIEERLLGKTLDKTRFGMIAEKPGCELIPARSARAKGRIGRLWETPQSRLARFFQFHGIRDMRSANAAPPAFIAEFNQRFHREPAAKDKTAFAPIPEGFDLDTLPAAKYGRETDNPGCFSFQNFIFQVDCPTPVVKKNILFLFGEKTGFKVYHNKNHHNVKFPAFLNGGKLSRLPLVTRRLIQDCFFSSVKNKELSSRGVNESRMNLPA